MSALAAASLGAGLATGVLLVVDGLRRRPDQPKSAPAAPSATATVTRRAAAARQQRRALGAASAFVALLLTRWPVAAAAAGLCAWFAPALFGSKTARDRETARTEAIAAWTEMLRDTMSGAHGLEEAVITTAAVAPDPIRREVATLAARAEREPLTSALAAFADDLAHPTADLVVAALMLAAGGSVGDLGELLGTLAVAARDEAAMRLRVEAARARLRTAVRVIAACTVATAGGLILLNRTYLDVYASVTGQVVLTLVATCWGIALWWLARMSEFVAPERFLHVPEATP